MKVNVVSITVHTLQILTFTHCPLPSSTYSAIDNSQLAYPSTYLSFASKQRERLLNRYVIAMSKQYIMQRNLASCVFTSVLLLTSVVRELQLLLLLHFRQVLGQNLRKSVFFFQGYVCKDLLPSLKIPTIISAQ